MRKVMVGLVVACVALSGYANAKSDAETAIALFDQYAQVLAIDMTMCNGEGIKDIELMLSLSKERPHLAPFFFGKLSGYMEDSLRSLSSTGKASLLGVEITPEHCPIVKDGLSGIRANLVR
jgi:hypothetical protein